MQIWMKNPKYGIVFVPFFLKGMGPLRFERKTSRLSAERSTWLSYGPETTAHITPSNLNLIFVKQISSHQNSKLIATFIIY